MTSDAMAIAWQVHRSAGPEERKPAEWPDKTLRDEPPLLSDRIPTSQLVKLLGTLEAPAGSALCVRAGLALGRAPVDAMWLLLRASGDLSTLLAHATRFWPTWTKTSHLQRQTHTSGITLELAPTWRNGVGLIRLHRLLAASLASLIADSGPGRSPVRVELPGEGDEGLARRLGDQLSAPVDFVADRARLHYGALDLEAPLRHSDPIVAAHLLRSMVRSVAELDRSISARLDALILEHLEAGISMEGAASALGLSERTLRRRLEDEETSYRERLDAVRRGYALTHLADRAVSDVARELGFMDIRSFQRAFRRWTSMTPLEFRRSITLE